MVIDKWIYAESFRGEQHLRCITNEAQAIIDKALAAGAGAVEEPRSDDQQRLAPPIKPETRREFIA